MEYHSLSLKTYAIMCSFSNVSLNCLEKQQLEFDQIQLHYDLFKRDLYTEV